MSGNSEKCAIDAHSVAMKKHVRFNYGISAAEGGIFLGGLTFVETNTVLPKIIDTLGGPDWLIAFVPLSMYLGITLPQIFVAHFIEQLSTMKRFVLTFGFLQRIVFLITGIFLLFASKFSTWIVIGLVGLTPLISGLFIGAHIAAWQELVARTIPAHRFSSLWAIRFTIGAAIGIVTGKLISMILTAFTGTTGYGILYCSAFGLFMISLAVIAMTKEPVVKKIKNNNDETASFSKFIKSVKPILREDKNLQYYLMVRIFSSGIYVIAPFLAIHAIEIMKKSDSYLGLLISLQMIGSIIAYAVGGYVGDKWGGKKVVNLNHITAIITIVWAALAHHQFEFFAIFILFGMTFGLNQIGINPLGIQLAPQNKRIIYMTIQGFSSFPGLFIAWGLAISGKLLSSNMVWLSVAAFAMMAISTYYLLRLKDKPTNRVVFQ